MIDSGHLDMLLNMDELPEFWNGFRKDFPRHPAVNGDPGFVEVPITIYGALA